MNFKYLTIMVATVSFAITHGAWASKDKLSKLVPDSKIVVEEGNEFEVLTSKNTAIEIEFNKDGTVDEASGNAADKGDIFIPENGFIPLSEVVSALKKSGKTVTGEWEFDKTLLNSWVYEVKGTNGDKKMKYILSAKDGKLIKERRDW